MKTPDMKWGETPIGRKFARLTVRKRVGTRSDGKPIWECECECGTFVKVISYNVLYGLTKSCGCLQKEGCRGGISRSKPHEVALEYYLWHKAKTRARKWSKKMDIPLADWFSIEPQDIHIPETCPVLGIPLFRGDGKPCDNSPSLDRKNSSKGYVRGNIQVISFRANLLKSNATVDELKRILLHLEPQT